MRGYWGDAWDCWMSPIQCLKAATGAGSSAPLTETTPADIAYRRMKMPDAPPEVIGVPKPAPPPSPEVVPDSEVPYGPGCAPGYIYDMRTGLCAKVVSPRPTPTPTPGPDAGSSEAQRLLRQQYLIWGLGAAFVGLALLVALRRRD